MRTATRKLLAGVIIFLGVLVPAWVLNMTNNWLSVRLLEYQVKRNADPIVLQQWATNLLAQHGGDLGGYQDFYGTNVPSWLKKVKADYPNVQIREPNEVWVFCSSKGSPFLVVGAPSLLTPTNRNIIPWKAGIYFVR